GVALLPFPGRPTSTAGAGPQVYPAAGRRGRLTPDPDAPMSWLLEDPTVAYIFLGVVALILAVLWWRGRDRRFLYGIAAVLVLVVLIGAVGMTIPNDGRQIRDSIDAMSAAVRHKDVDALFSHISDDFRVRGLDRKGFRDLVQRAVRENLVTD